MRGMVDQMRAVGSASGRKLDSRQYLRGFFYFFQKKTLSGLSLTGSYGGVKEGKEEKLQPLVGFYSNMRATVFF